MDGSRFFFQGGPCQTTRKQSGQCLFNSLERGSNGFITGKTTILFQRSRGVQHFPGRGGGPTFPGGGGVQMLISIENHMTCDFQGG